MMTINDFKTAEEQIEYIRGILESTQRILNDLSSRSRSTGVSHDRLKDIEKAFTYELINAFFWGGDD